MKVRLKIRLDEAVMQRCRTGYRSIADHFDEWRGWIAHVREYCAARLDCGLMQVGSAAGAGRGATANEDHPFTDVSALSMRIECPPAIWTQIAAFVIAGFDRAEWGGPEVGGLLLGGRAPDGGLILSWREIRCEHANGPVFELSERDGAGLRQLLANLERDATSQDLQVVGWFRSRYGA